MNTIIKVAMVLCFLVSTLPSISQNETKKWYFGGYAGLDFMTSPPTVLTGSMSTQNNCVSMADAAGNLMFYSNGTTIWNQNHQIMANGTGLAGNLSTTVQGEVLVVKKPGSNTLYYVFTADYVGPNYYRYSIIDMSLAAGMGSVTTKNALLWNTSPNFDGSRMAAVKHCNGVDYWITCHAQFTTEYHSFLLSSAGINTVAVMSNVGDAQSGFGAIRFSPNGKKIALATYPTSAVTGSINIHDFDNSTGQVSTNFIRIINGTVAPLGMEFSPDGTKLYSTGVIGNPSNSLTVFQWDLCSGNELAINNSIIPLIATSTYTGGAPIFYYMQIGPDGKLYICLSNNGNQLVVVNQPNLLGTACGYSLQSQVQAPGTSIGRSLPNFPASFFRNLQASLESTVICQHVQFNLPSHSQTTNGCSSTNYPLIATHWNFGDIASATNTSNISNPIHYYNSLGSYTVQLILQYNCTSDTIYKVISIINANPTFSIGGRTTICKGETSTLTATGSSSTYSWSTGATTPSVILTNTNSTNFTVVATGSNNCTTSKVVPFTVNKCLGYSEFQDQLIINIYPNPVKESLKIETNTPVTFTIFNNTGQLLMQKDNLGNGQEINLSELASGLYFVRLSTNKWSQIKPIIKE